MTGEPLNRFAVIPGYREAVERENLIREVAFLDIPEFICGIEVLPLTPRHFLLLDAIGSVFVSGGVPSPEEVARFLWVVSPEFRTVKTWRDRRVRKRFVKRCRKVLWADACIEIDRYIDDAFQDSPGHKSGQSGAGDWAWVAVMVDNIASEYHWSERDILNTPVKSLFQYSRLQTKRHNPNAILFNSSDRLKSEYLRNLNA